MRKIFTFVALTWFLGIGIALAQDSGSTDVNIPDPSDEALVQGNGTQPGQNSTGFHVNTFTGDAWATVTDFNYKRIGFPMKFERYFHNGITSPFAEMGPGWMSNYDICLYVPVNGASDHALLVMPHQTWQFNASNGGNNFTPPPGCFDQLQPASTSSVFSNPPSNYSSTTYLLTDKNGLVYKFNVLVGGEQNLARLVEMDDLNGNKLTLTYQTFNVFQETIDSATWSLSSYRLQTVGGNNFSINFTYYDNNVNNSIFTTDISGNRLQQVTNSAGDTITFDTGAQTGPITQVSRSPSSLNATYQYYSYPVTIQDIPSTNTTLKQVIDPMAPIGYRNLTYVSEDIPSTGINNPVRQIVNNMGQVMFIYDYSTNSFGNKVVGTSGPNGLIEADVYDSTSRIIQKRFQVDGHPYTESYSWNANVLMTNKVDGNGNPVSMAYDSLGNMTYRKDAEGYYENYNYSFYNYPSNLVGTDASYYFRLTSSTDKNQISRSYNYDGNGNLLIKNEPGRITSYTYSSQGLLSSTTDANQHTTSYQYDGNGCVTFIQEPSVAGQPGAITSFTYDSNGRGLLSSKTDPLQKTTHFYLNSNNFPATIVFADSSEAIKTYNGDGAVTQTTDQDSNVTNTYLDAEDRPVSTVQAAGTTVARATIYQLDPVGNQLSITDGKGQTTRFVYNEQNLVRTSTDSSGVGATNAYDGVLNLLTSRDTRNITKTMTYYKNNRLKTASFSDGTPGLAYTYDGNGNKKSMTDGVGLKIYNYDPLNRLTSMSDSTRNFTLNYTYDSVGNRLSMQNNKVLGTTHYGYYENNLMKAVTDVDGMAMSCVYDLMKNPINVVCPNGASVTYSYDTYLHRLTSLQNLNSHQEILSSFNYAYDSIGNINSVTDLTGTTSYSYDNLYQLASATYPGPQSLIGYKYDGAGNRTNLNPTVGSPTSYNNGPGNELTSDSNESFSYDGNGNITQRSSSGGTTYIWDAQNQLVQVKMSSGSVTFVYDGDGHRVQKTTSKGVINYFYDGSSVVVETDGNANVLRSYEPGISVKDQQGNKLFYLSNGHGDVTGVVDINQKIILSYSYDTFGAVIGDQKDTNNYRYVGLEDVYSDDDIGLSNMWHRWYDPKLGRFVSRDPIGFSSGDTNFYGYCKNNPVGAMDPGGEDEYTSVDSGGNITETPPGGYGGQYSGGSYGGFNPSSYNGYGGGGWSGYQFYGSWMWQYHQSTGYASLFDPHGYFTGIGFLGYSGNNCDDAHGLNNPDANDISNVGPIPRGVWSMPAAEQRGRMPDCFNLVAVDVISDRDLTSFWIHGDYSDSRRGTYGASEGCVIFDLNIRIIMNTYRGYWNVIP